MSKTIIGQKSNSDLYAKLAKGTFSRCIEDGTGGQSGVLAKDVVLLVDCDKDHILDGLFVIVKLYRNFNPFFTSAIPQTFRHLSDICHQPKTLYQIIPGKEI